MNDYVRYRPGYPEELATELARRVGYHNESVIADVGSGTGISTRYFLDRGNLVYAVEPNADMRRAAEEWLGSYAKFRSVAARAEATTLPDASVDLVVAAQAFHWFDADRAKQEFRRILRPDSHLVVLWNERKTDTTAFLQEYEALLWKWSEDYAAVSSRTVAAEESMQNFFGPELWGVEEFTNQQSLDLQGLIGRALSSSYVPLPEHPNHEPMLAELRELFSRHAQDGRVFFEYATRLFWGRLGN